MTRDDIIAMARGSEWLGKYESSTGFSAECAVKFAALVASAEREACAYRAGIALLGADRGLANRVDQAIQAREKA